MGSIERSAEAVKAYVTQQSLTGIFGPQKPCNDIPCFRLGHGWTQDFNVEIGQSSFLLRVEVVRLLVPGIFDRRDRRGLR